MLVCVGGGHSCWYASEAVTHVGMRRRRSLMLSIVLKEVLIEVQLKSLWSLCEVKCRYNEDQGRSFVAKSIGSLYEAFFVLLFASELEIESSIYFTRGSSVIDMTQRGLGNKG
eukprot:Blabericola_migrator_1__4563@NODE_2428_length_2779_cov_24_416667_g1174_i2_p2_GENE_NODE_2428_length_2779_cov_24_416667_g1174_i2NODE_2428_length_2779_cov_24_416667_g1174_i2_p2_ORF_typecomplete_len113_score17_26YjcB/PF15940_5/87YjcB/PF15940_5/0_77YjcB/PF15940_5/9_7e02_NODE_2428_length_2779_cov_24_416667_g1174_i29561294